MKFENIFKSAFAMLAFAFAAACTPQEKPDDEDNKNTDKDWSKVTFVAKETKSKTTASSADIFVFHNGEEDCTWYGLLTEDLDSDKDKLIAAEVKELLKSGDLESRLHKSVEEHVQLTGLKEGTEYRYIAFGLDKEGETYGKAGECTFTTNPGAYRLTGYWSATFNGYRNEKVGEDLKNCVCLKMSQTEKGADYFFPMIVDPESYYYTAKAIEASLKNMGITYTDADIEHYFAREVGLYYQSYFKTMMENGYTMDKLAFSDLAKDDEYFEPRHYSSQVFAEGFRDYRVFILGFKADGTPTKEYSLSKMEFPADVASEEYNNWLGYWDVTDVDGKTGEPVENSVTFRTLVKEWDPNYAYYMHGWEVGNKDLNTDMGKIFGSSELGDDYSTYAEGYFNPGTKGFDLQDTYITYTTIQNIDGYLGLFGWFSVPVDSSSEEYVFWLYTQGLWPGYGRSSDNIASIIPHDTNRNIAAMDGAVVDIYETDNSGQTVTTKIKYSWMQYTFIHFENLESENPDEISFDLLGFNETTQIPHFPCRMDRITEPAGAAQAFADSDMPKVKPRSIEKIAIHAHNSVFNRR